tara:strand:+ start:5416 stop:5622 length:207 start_codon:yes stop_codon:yes gene_type:complete
MIEPTERQKGVLHFLRIRVETLRSHLKQVEQDYEQEAQNIINQNKNGYPVGAQWSLGDDLNFHLVEEE